MFLQSPHQVDMKNVVEFWQDFFGYFNDLETHSAYVLLYVMVPYTTAANAIQPSTTVLQSTMKPLLSLHKD